MAAECGLKWGFMTYLLICLVVAYPVSQVSYRWHNPTMAVGYEGELQLSQFDIINTKYRQVLDKLCYCTFIQSLTIKGSVL